MTNFGIMSTGEGKEIEIILNRKEAKRIERLLHYLSVTGQFGVKTDFEFWECFKEHLK